MLLNIQQYAVLWDVDGTLVDTAELHFAAWLELCKELGRPFTRGDFAATFGKRNPEILTFLFGNDLDERRIADLAFQKEEIYKLAARRGVTLLPGVGALLAAFHAAGVPQAIASSAPRGNVNLILELTQTAPFFQAIVSFEDTTLGKPDPQVFLLAADRLQRPASRCVVFEDAVAGVQAAKAAGMKCVAVSFVGHHPVEKLQQAGAHLVVQSLEGLTPEQVFQLFTAGKQTPSH
jgi:beta-phosphoglucomutase